MAPPPALMLTRLMLRDFRSYPALTLPFHGRIVVISGENGVGKTNLLEAISLLGPRPGPAGCPHRRFRPPAGGRPAALGRRRPVRGQCRIALARLRHRHRHAGWRPDRAPGVPAGRRPGPQPGRAGGTGGHRLADPADGPAVPGRRQSGRRRFLDRLVWALEPHHAREVAAHETAMAQPQPPAGPGTPRGPCRPPMAGGAGGCDGAACRRRRRRPARPGAAG